MTLSRYAAKKARQAAELLAAEQEPEPEVQPGEDTDGGHAFLLDSFTPEQLARYRESVESWRAETGQVRPGSRTRRSLRLRALREVPS